MAGCATVTVGGESFRVTREDPFVFGRADRPGVVGLDDRDMGISGLAGCLESLQGIWWIVNRSGKRSLLLDLGAGGNPQQLGPGRRYAMTQPQITVLVPGALATHALRVEVPAADMLDEPKPASTDTLIGLDEVELSRDDRLALAALLVGYLESFPRYDPHPRTYDEAATRLGVSWTPTAVRRRIDKVKDRLKAAGWYFEGRHANAAMADCLIGHGLISSADLDLLRSEQSGA